jgi:two-component system, NarL family, nitrate/nitrite response regulator NarL
MIRIVIVGEIRLYRDGLAEVLNTKPGVEVVGSLSNRYEAYEAIPELRPDVVLLDMATAGSHEAVSRIRELAPDTRVLALGIADVERDIIGCAEAGIAGYVPREGSFDSLVGAIQGAVLGELHCSPRMAGTLLRRIAALSRARSDGAGIDSLTSREKEILRLIEEGCCNKDIARHLGIEVATVKNHVHNLLEKLHVHRRGEAAAQVRGWGARTPRVG